MMENTVQRETDKEDADQSVESKGKVDGMRCFHKPAVRVAAVLVGIAVAVVVILSVYAAGVFDSGPELPEVMEGEATFQSDDGKEEAFNVIIDYKRKLVQLTSMGNPSFSAPLSGRRLMSFKENVTANGNSINLTKIVIQDYNTQRKYFIIPEHGKSTTKCIYAVLKGDMIPRHLLKDATLKWKKIAGDMTHLFFQVDNNTKIDVFKATGYHGKIYEIYLYLPNGTIHMRSKEQGMKFTDYKKLNCYKYLEEDGTIEDAFFKSADSKMYTESDVFADPSVEKRVKEMASNLSIMANKTTSPNNATLNQQLSSAATRRRRWIRWINCCGNWWYGNWCGPYQGGYTCNPNPQCQGTCFRTTSFVNQDCRNCLPPRDGLDEECMEHDRCIIHHGSGPWWCQPCGNRCICDSLFVERLFNACSSWNCFLHALQIFNAVFRRLSCWFPIRICFPIIWFVCRCISCLCPIIIDWICIVFRMCAFFGSGVVFA